MDSNMFNKYQESRGQSGYKSAILVKKPTDSKYSLLVASETVPSVFGSQNSFEFDLLNSPVTGKIKGKISLEDKEVECLLHRDNVYRFEQLRDLVCDFLYLTPDLVGYKFTGTIAFKPNDAEAEVLRGTYTITPMSADDEPIMDCRGIIEETICITEAVEDSVVIGSTGKEISITCSVADFTITTAIKNNDGTSTDYTATVTAPTTGSKTGKVTISKASGTEAGDYAIIYITVSKTGYASWTTTVALDAE